MRQQLFFLGLPPLPEIPRISPRRSIPGRTSADPHWYARALAFWCLFCADISCLSPRLNRGQDVKASRSTKIISPLCASTPLWVRSGDAGADDAKVDHAHDRHVEPFRRVECQNVDRLDRLDAFTIMSDALPKRSRPTTRTRNAHPPPSLSLLFSLRPGASQHHPHSCHEPRQRGRHFPKG